MKLLRHPTKKLLHLYYTLHLLYHLPIPIHKMDPHETIDLDLTEVEKHLIDSLFDPKLDAQLFQTTKEKISNILEQHPSITLNSPSARFLPYIGECLIRERDNALSRIILLEEPRPAITRPGEGTGLSEEEVEAIQHAYDERKAQSLAESTVLLQKAEEQLLRTGALELWIAIMSEYLCGWDSTKGEPGTKVLVPVDSIIGIIKYCLEALLEAENIAYASIYAAAMMRKYTEYEY